MASLTSDSRVIYATNTMKQVDTKREPAIRTNLKVCVLMAVFYGQCQLPISPKMEEEWYYLLILPTSSSGVSISIFEKPNHFFPKSLIDAPIFFGFHSIKFS